MRISAIRRAGGMTILLFLGGCISSTAVLKDFQERPSAIGLTLVDKRPADDKTTSMLSYWVTSCNYGIKRLGDENSNPSRLVYLQRDLENELGNQLQNTVVTVSRYRVFFNNAVQLRSMVNRGQGGLIAALMTGVGANCSREETAGGWYAPYEVKTSYSPLIVEIEVTVNGKTYDVRTVYSLDEEVPSLFGAPQSAKALFAAFHEANEELIEEIRTGKPQAPPEATESLLPASPPSGGAPNHN